MKDEMKSMQDNVIWDLIELPKGLKPIGCKWIFKTKKDSKGNIERYKARLVAKVFTQKEGIDYKETFSLVSSKDSFRTIMTLVTHFDLELHQMDVKTAFLNGDIDEKIYMVQPENKLEDTLIAKGDKFSLKQCPNNDLERNEMQKIPYASALGSLMYVQVCTRLDITFVVGVLGRNKVDDLCLHFELACGFLEKRRLLKEGDLVEKDHKPTARGCQELYCTLQSTIMDPGIYTILEALII
ncbi:hypothetical protein CR513_19066, partial [Mucuna pruriens]